MLPSDSVTARPSSVASSAVLRYGRLAIVLAYVAPRIGLAFTEGSPIFGWRPTEEVSIALGYLRNGFHLFYPQVFWGGSGPGYAEMEFPIVPFFNAILFRMFGVHEWITVALSQVLGFGIVWLVFRFGRYLAGDTAGVAGGLVAAVGPPLIFMTTTGLWPDPPMVLFGALGLYFLARWADAGRPADLWLGSTCVSMAILLKLTALYLGIPVLYLFIKKYGRSFWKAPPTWMAGIGILLPPLLWYLHAYRLALEYHNSFGILASGATKLGSASLLLGGEFYVWVVNKIILYHLTPIGAVAFAIGLVAIVVDRSQPLLLVWLGSVGLATLVAAKGVRGGHYQYLLPILPVGSIVSGVGVARLFDRVGRSAPARKFPQWAVMTAIVGLLALEGGAAWARRRFEVRDRGPDSEVWAKKKITGQVAKNLTAPGSLLIVVDTEMDAETPATSMTPPDVFYFADRKGWYVSLAWLRTERIEELRQSGARYLVVSAQSVSDFKARTADIFAWLSARYRKVLDGDEGIVFDLGETP
jgi:hypothetical protein